MARHNCYQPAISRELIRVLYFEGKHRGMPMTRLIDEVLTGALRDTPGWQIAEKVRREKQANNRQNQSTG